MYYLKNSVVWKFGYDLPAMTVKLDKFIILRSFSIQILDIKMNNKFYRLECKMASSRIPDAFSTVTHRSASALLPRFKEVLVQWPVDEARRETSPGTPDIGVYLREYIEKSVETDKVSFEAAKAELDAAERLLSKDIFKRFPNVTEVGVTGLGSEDLRNITVYPRSKETKKILKKLMRANLINDRKHQIKKGVYFVAGLFVLLTLAKIWNAIIRNKNLQQ